MKITKAKLKQIIKEELEVVLTNEEAGEMFGESVEDQLNEQGKVLNEDLEFFMQQVQDPAAWELMARALAKIITNFAPAAFGAAAVMAVRRALGYDKEYEEEELPSSQRGMAGSSREDTLAAYKKNPEYFN